MNILWNYGCLSSALHFVKRQQPAILMGILVLTIPMQVTAQSDDYDQDCAVIVCLAQGFPAGCYAAYDFMLDRLKHGNSPFGTCTSSDGKDYKNIITPYDHLDRYSRSGWYCPKNTQLHHEVKQSNNGKRDLTAFCYRDNIIKKTEAGEDSESHLFYRGKRPATRVNFRIQITVDPGTNQEYRSPTYLLNYHTGFFVEYGK